MNRPARHTARRFGLVVAGVALLAAGGAVAVLAAPRPACASTHEVLGVVPSTDGFRWSGTLPQRAIAAGTAIRRGGGYEGIWVDPHGNVAVGVYGPSWKRVHAAAAAVASEAGPQVTYICQPTTERRLAAAQDALGGSPLWRTGEIGFSDIDTRNATVTVTIVDTAPASTEADLRRTYGPLLSIGRARAPIVDMAPATGRVPLAQDATTAP